MPNKNNAAPKRNTANRNVVPTRSTSGNSKVNNTVYKTSQRKLGYIIKSTFQIITLCVLLTVAIGIFYFYHAYGKIILQLQAEAKQKISSSTEDTFRAVQTSLVYDAQGNLISKTSIILNTAKYRLL